MEDGNVVIGRYIKPGPTSIPERYSLSNTGSSSAEGGVQIYCNSKKVLSPGDTRRLAGWQSGITTTRLVSRRIVPGSPLRLERKLATIHIHLEHTLTWLM